MNSRLKMTLTILVVLCVSVTCFFWSGVVAAQFGPWIGVTEAKSSQGFPYMHGGIGSAEREYMEERGKSYNVKFSFADKKGPYLASVRLVLGGEDRTEIVDIISDGPWFYIQLPPGTYNLKATFGRKTNEIKALKVSKDKKINQTLIWDLGGEADQVAVR